MPGCLTTGVTSSSIACVQSGWSKGQRCMKFSLTLIAMIVTVVVFACGAVGQEQVKQLLKMAPINARMSAPRLEMQALTEKPDAALEGVVLKRTRSADETGRVSLRAAARQQKTKRVVAAQN